jgi:hypothetical protein
MQQAKEPIMKTYPNADRELPIFGATAELHTETFSSSADETDDVFNSSIGVGERLRTTLGSVLKKSIKIHEGATFESFAGLL